MQLDNRNIKSLDGLRGYSILLVLLSHIGFGKIVPGGVGVTIFFFVSGFLICKLLLFELKETQKIHFFSFYVRRFFRLYPALLFFLLLVIGIHLYFNQQIYSSEVLSSLFYFMNYNMVYLRTFHSTLITSFDILWSLSIEEHFYILFPFVLVKTYKYKKLFLAISVLVCMICLAYRIHYGLVLDSKRYEYVIYHLTHTRLDSIMFGCLAAYLLYSSSGERNSFYEFISNKYVFFISVAVMGLCLITRNHFFRETFRYSLQGIALMSIVVNIIYSNLIPTFLFSGKFIVFIGRLSYSLYLFHWVSISFANQVADEFTSKWYLIVLPSTIVLSMFSYFYVEKPFVALRKKFGSNV